jgi:ABC-type lipoprotein export system ATPase subunit
MSVLSVQSVSYSYKTKYQTVQAVKDVSCDLSAGTLYALVGKSGSGKTTLLSLLAGLDTPQSGDIMVNGQSLREIDVDIYRRKQASVIYQSYNLFPLPMPMQKKRHRLLLKKSVWAKVIGSDSLPCCQAANSNESQLLEH